MTSSGFDQFAYSAFMSRTFRDRTVNPFTDAVAAMVASSALGAIPAGTARYRS